MELMAAILKYALAGVGSRLSKGTLANGTSYVMDTSTEKVGDRQYHWWKIVLSSTAPTLTVAVTSISNGNVDLYLKGGSKPTKRSYDYRSINTGTSNEAITISHAAATTLWVGVYGNHSVLNGAKYTLRASW
jgi:hypothetical protein